MKFEDIIGKTFVTVIAEGGYEDRIVFTEVDGTQYAMKHFQDCCEQVGIEDIDASLDILVDTPIISAYESTEDGEDELWTFYRASTVKGTVCIRWHGTSEYYSTSVDFGEVI